MKKKYRVIIDYEVDINEKVRVPDSEEIRPENLEKMKKIIDAFIDHPDIMNEYHKLRFFECVMVPEVSADIGELFRVKTFDAIMNSLGQHLPRETASYLISLFCCSSVYKYEGTDEDLSREFDLILNLLGELVAFRASFKEIGDEPEMDVHKENGSIMPVVVIVGQQDIGALGPGLFKMMFQNHS